MQTLVEALKKIAEQGGDIVEPWAAEIARAALHHTDKQLFNDLRCVCDAAETLATAYDGENPDGNGCIDGESIMAARARLGAKFNDEAARQGA